MAAQLKTFLSEPLELADSRKGCTPKEGAHTDTGYPLTGNAEEGVHV